MLLPKPNKADESRTTLCSTICFSGSTTGAGAGSGAGSAAEPNLYSTPKVTVCKSGS